MDTLEHLVEALCHIAYHLTVPPTIFIVGSCPLCSILDVPIEKRLTLSIKLSV
jgi:hypothetical protein